MQVDLGSDVFTNERVNINIPREGIILFICPSRYGKTSLIKRLLIETRGIRKTIIFDFKQSEYATLQDPNFLSEESGALKNVITLKATDFGFYSTDLDAQDLATFDFTKNASNVFIEMALMAGDDHKLLYQMLIDYPTDDNYIYAFKKKYGMKKEVAPMHKQTKANILNHFINIIQQKRIITTEDAALYGRTDGKDGRQHLDYRLLANTLKQGHIRFDFDLARSDAELARFYAGKIMNMLRSQLPCGKCGSCRAGRHDKCIDLGQSLLQKYHPIIVAEEGDTIFPNTSTLPMDKPLPSSSLEGQAYAIKEQRQGFVLIVSTQMKRLIDPVFLESFSYQILGPNTDDSLSQKLNFDKARNIRQFLLIKFGQWKQVIFQAGSLPCVDPLRNFENCYIPLKKPALWSVTGR